MIYSFFANELRSGTAVVLSIDEANKLAETAKQPTSGSFTGIPLVASSPEKQPIVEPDGE